jgi:ribosome maturation protein SDO1
MSRLTYDPEKFNLSTARLKKAGQTFEIVVDPDKAIDYKEIKKTPIEDVLKYEKIFADAQRGLKAPESTFKDIFKTDKALDIAKIILDEGEVVLTAEHRKKQIEKKKKQIIGIIHRYGVDPRTDAPHTLVRIESALDESKIKIDEFESPELQVKKILKKLNLLLPLRFETKQIEVVLPAKYANSTYSYLKKTHKITKETWGNSGEWTGVIEIPGGLEDEFMDILNKLTHGSVQIRVLGHR